MRSRERVASDGSARREFFDEPGHEELLLILDTLREPDLGERAADQRARSQEAAMEHGPGASRRRRRCPS